WNWLLAPGGRMTFCIRTCRDASFSSGIWKYTVGRNCDGVRGGSACDHATAASMPDARIVAGTINLFMGHLPQLVTVIGATVARPQRKRCGARPQHSAARNGPGRLPEANNQ